VAGKPWHSDETEWALANDETVDTFFDFCDRYFETTGKSTERTAQAWLRMRQHKGFTYSTIKPKQARPEPKQLSNEPKEAFKAALHGLLRKEPMSRYQILETLAWTPKELDAELSKLAEAGVVVDELHDQLHIPREAVWQSEPEATTLDATEVDPGRARLVRFGVVSDTHLNSSHCKLDALHDVYRRFKEAGITDVFHAGDLDSGENIYRGQRYEIDRVGVQARLDFCVENYPQVASITTHLVGGNHDEGDMKTIGVDFIRAFGHARPDFNILGWYYANTTYGDIKLGLWHGDGGGAYALSYKSQKFIEKMEGGSKPDILLVGHYHDALQYNYRNIHVIHGGCFEGRTRFAIRKGLPCTIGGWIVEAELEQTDKRAERTLRTFRTELIRYYLDEAGEII